MSARLVLITERPGLPHYTAVNAASMADVVALCQAAINAADDPDYSDVELRFCVVPSRMTLDLPMWWERGRLVANRKRLLEMF